MIKKEFIDNEPDLGAFAGNFQKKTFIPPLENKYVSDIEYFCVVLISHNRIIQNNLFFNLASAEKNFVNLVCEYAGQPISKEKAAQFAKYKFYRIENGSITISKPNISS